MKSVIQKVPMSDNGVVLLKGIAASQGVVEGQVVVVRSLEDVHRMKPMGVLVAVETTPSYVPAMLQAAAIVTDRGGLLSHPAIVARELGIPAVVGTGRATSVLVEGQHVVVDGTKGTVNSR